MKPFISEIEQHHAVIHQLTAILGPIEASVRCIEQTLINHRKLLFCGNGGSAADCQHLAAEFVVRYEKQRQALAAIALTTDTSILTAHSNDFSFDSVFARQVCALGLEGDCLIAISTSGRSENVVQAARIAKQKSLSVIALSGGDGGDLKEIADIAIIVPSSVTARIQEAHILIGHWWCGVIEEKLRASNNS